MDILINKFTSNENKGLIWNLMCNEGLFTDIPDTESQRVKNGFDLIVKTISGQITTQDTLMNLNKQVISEMNYKITNYTTPKTNEPELSSMTLNYNAAEISKTRQTKFQNEFTHKKQEFDKFNNVPVPEKIDFSDNLDSPIGSELDKILAEQIALREKQLNMVLQTQDKHAANEWIQNPGVQSPDIKTPDIKKLKIGEPIQDRQERQDRQEPLKLKKVNFMDTTNTTNTNTNTTTRAYSNQTNENENFLSLLKKKRGIYNKK